MWIVLTAFAADPNIHPETGEAHTPMYSDKMTITDQVVALWPADLEAEDAEMESTTCDARVFVTAQGSVTYAAPTCALEGLTDTARQWAQSMTFEPIVVDGKPIPVVTNVELSFKRPSDEAYATFGIVRATPSDEVSWIRGGDEPPCDMVVQFDAGGWFAGFEAEAGCPSEKELKKALKKWRIKPPVENGRPKAARVQLESK